MGGRRSSRIDVRSRPGFYCLADLRLRTSHLARRATAGDQRAAQLRDILRRRQAARAVAQAYVAQAAPNSEFSFDRRLDGKRELVSEHRVEIIRRQSVARR